MVTDKTIRVGRAKSYPNEVWWFVSCFIFTVAIFQYGSWAISKLLRRRAAAQEALQNDTEGGGAGPNRRFSVRRLPLAILNAYRVVAFRWTLEIGSWYTLNFAEVFVTCSYIIAIFIWEFGNTTDLEGHKLDMTYWGNRAGTIAASQIPLVTALGTKNNVVAYITGISYDKLNYIHRMTARVMFVLLWVHGGAKFNSLDPGEIDASWVRAGILAMAAFSLLILVSLRPIRANVYEFFFLTHFSMVLIFLLGAYFHAKDQNMSYYIWPSFIFWALDRFIRLMRVVVFNHQYFWFKSSGSLDGTVELLSPHFLRLRLSRPPHFHWRPGQTAYLIMPTVSASPFEAHPFTIASVDTSDEMGGDLEKKELGETTPFWKELVFLINVRSGVTKRLATIAQTGAKVKVAVDGPYGFSPDLSVDDTVVLISGGSGITFTLSSFLGVVNDVRNGKSSCRKIIFIWAIRDAAHIEWISKTLSKALEVAPSYLSISIRIYVTSREPLPATNPKAWDDDSIHGSENSEDKSRAPSLLESPAVQVVSGRPDLHILLRDEALANTGRMSVTVCGSQAIARACRAALRFPVSGPKSILQGCASVVLHVETFGYA
ncbi:iron reductase [Sparassis crispa]|uniref:ferric-chelate reductase (NADPH) n=1 Tax=Sparassis crispa TaxID=139825 RepID=A0A401GPX0_9APHY|nr:iron reductase [Sparassis crispa]GBE84199.1 iron reductase [Sparassis crispa]